MPKKSQPRAEEFFFIRDGKRQDAELHESILSEGDDAAARAVSDKVLRRLGFSDDDIAALHGATPKQEKALRTRARGGDTRDEGEHEEETEQTEIELWPEEGERRDDFMDRCTVELEKCIGDRAEEVCDEKWHQSRILGTKGFVTVKLTGNLAIESCGETCVCGGNPKSSTQRLHLDDLLIPDKGLHTEGHEPEPHDRERREDAGRLDSARAEAGREHDGAASQADGAGSDRGIARSRDVARDFDEAKHPRDEHGRWTEGGGSDGDGDDDIAIPAEHIAGTFKRGGITVHALTPDGAEQFHDAINGAKAANKYGASVHVYEQGEYRDVKMFLTPDGLAGLGVKPDGDIVSVFKDPNSPLKAGFAEAALSLATQQGGNKLDAFDTVLPGLYGDNGFRAVARLAWNDEYAPPGWDKATFGKFNSGQPDVVFMVHDPGHAQAYKAGDGARVSSYDEGVAAQAAALKALGKSKAFELRDFDESKHPRDEFGRFSESGGGGSSEPPSTPGEDKQLLISHNPSTDRLNYWKTQIDARQKELEAAGQLGSEEDNNLQKMSSALYFWANTSEQDRNSGKWGISVVYNYPDGEVAVTKLQAIVTTQFNPQTRVALTEGKGGIDHDAMVKAFKMTIDNYSETHHAERIENNEFVEDVQMVKAAEEAGFRKIGRTDGGVQQMIWGTEETTREKPPSLEHLPVPIQISEGVGGDFKAEIAVAFTSIPPRALKTIADSGIKIRAGAKLTELKPELKGVHPRGWPAGMTWDTAEGCYDRGTKEVLVSELYRPVGKREFVPSSRIRGVAAHETGHAYDQALGSPSGTSSAFIYAYTVDRKSIPKEARRALRYYLQKGKAGRSEAFAEVFAHNTGSTGAGRTDIRPFFPRVSKLVKEAMDRGLWLEPIA